MIKDYISLLFSDCMVLIISVYCLFLIFLEALSQRLIVLQTSMLLFELSSWWFLINSFSYLLGDNLIGKDGNLLLLTIICFFAGVLYFRGLWKVSSFLWIIWLTSIRFPITYFFNYLFLAWHNDCIFLENYLLFFGGTCWWWRGVSQPCW